MKSLLNGLVFACLAMLLQLSCNREDLRPSLDFLPCAQILFQDSLIERNLLEGIDALKTNIPFTVKSPVGLKSVKVSVVNQDMDTKAIDTVPAIEFTSFDDAYNFAQTYGITLAGNSISITISAKDTRNQMSSRSLPVIMENKKKAPAFSWMNSNGTDYAGKRPSMIVRKYSVVDSFNYNTRLYARLVSYNGGTAPNFNMSWGMDKVDVYAVYSNGSEVRLAETSKNFSDPTTAASCIGCRYKYEFNFKPEWEQADGSTVTQIKVVAEDLRYQRTRTSINVTVLKDYAVPEIAFMEVDHLVDPTSPVTPPIPHYVQSYDTRLRRLIYYVVRANGQVDSIGYNTNISVPNPDITGYARTIVNNVSIQNYTPDMVAFRVRAINGQNKESYKDLPLTPTPAIEGVAQIFRQVVFTRATRKEKPYIYSLATKQTYKDGDECDSPDFVFDCSSTANLYLQSPSTSGSNDWIGNKTRRTRYYKVPVSAYDNATRVSLEALRSEIKDYGELSVSAKSRTPQSLVGIVKEISVTDGAVSAVEDANIVTNYPSPDLWKLVKMGYDSDRTPAWWYDHEATRAEAAVNVAYAFINEDDIVGVIKLEEAFAWLPGYPNKMSMGNQRITFSVRYVNR